METILEPPLNLSKRLRRNRISESIRSLVEETCLKASNLVAPLFILEGEEKIEWIPSMPGISRMSVDLIVKEAISLYKLGIRAVALFPFIPNEKKDPLGIEALRDENLICQTLSALKKEIPQMCLIADVALDPYTDHGHDGILNDEGYVLNDATVLALSKMALLAAGAGADIVAPSDMMDGRIAYIRSYLDKNGFSQVGILSYAAKYASSLYGPFRDALGSSLKSGDKKSYQMNPANVREALRECALDEEEGADMLMIKPALSYLDVIAKVRGSTNLPLAAYHVSGEYAMVKAAAEKGWINGENVLFEHLLSIKRAGADFILTYAAKEIALKLKAIASDP